MHSKIKRRLSILAEDRVLDYCSDMIVLFVDSFNTTAKIDIKNYY